MQIRKSTDKKDFKKINKSFAPSQFRTSTNCTSIINILYKAIENMHLLIPPAENQN